MRRLLSLPGFGRLAAAYLLNELAWSVGTLALTVLVYRRTGSALGSAGFFLVSMAAPALISPALVGRLDRGSPRVLLPLLYWTEALLFALLAWLTHRFELVPVFGIALLDGVVALVARSLATGARTELVKPAGLVRENQALVNSVFSVCYLVGPLIGGGVVALGGTVLALAINAGLFFVMGFTLIGDSIPRRIVHDGPASGRLRAALSHAFRDRPLATLLGVEAVVVVCFTIPIPIEVVFADHTLHAGAAGYGALLSAWGGGSVLGSILYIRWRRGTPRALLGVATAALGIGFGVMALAPSLVVALIGAAIAGIGNTVTTGALGGEIQERTPQSWIPLVMSVSQSIGQLAPGLGIAIGGVLTTLVSVRFTLGTAALASLLVAGAMAPLLSPMRLDRALSLGPIEDAAGADGAAGSVDPCAGERVLAGPQVPPLEPGRLL